MGVMSDLDAELRQAAKEIHDIQAEYHQWIEENEHLCGRDDEAWYDTIAWFDERLGSAGIALADIVTKLIGPDE